MSGFEYDGGPSEEGVIIGMEVGAGVVVDVVIGVLLAAGDGERVGVGVGAGLQARSNNVKKNIGVAYLGFIYCSPCMVDVAITLYRNGGCGASANTMIWFGEAVLLHW